MPDIDRYQRALDILGPNATPDAIASLQQLAGMTPPKSPSFAPAHIPQPLQQPGVGDVTQPTVGLPEGYTGGEYGPQGEALPQGASAFNRYGEAYFGDEDYDPGFFNDIGQAIKNYLGGVGYRMSKPVEAQKGLTEGISQETQQQAAADVQTGQNSGAQGQVASTIFSNAIHDWENVPGGIHFLTRGVSELVKGGLTLLSQPALWAERGIGTAYGVAKGLEVDEAYEASRLTYSAWMNPALRDEFVRRYRAGENPILLAAELENPLHEAIGQLVLDPFNLIAAAPKLLGLGGKGAKLDQAAKLATVLDDASDLGQAFKTAESLTDAAEVGKTVIPVLRTEVGRVGQTMTRFAQDVGAFKPTASAKAAVVSDLFHNTVSAVLPLIEKDQVADTLIAWATIASNTGDEKAMAWATGVMLKSPARNVMLSEAGLRSGVAFADGILDDAGKLSGNKVKNLKNLILQAKTAESPVAALIEGLDPLVQKTTKKMFPSIRERVANAPKIQGMLDEGKPLPRSLQRFVEDGKIVDVPPTAAWLEDVGRRLDSGIGGVGYQKINKFFAAIYMGMSPAYYFRNTITNTLHMLVDDIDSLRVGGKSAEKWLTENNLLNAQALKGLGGGPSGTIAGLNEKKTWWNFFTRQSSKAEHYAGVKVSYSAVRKSLGRMAKHIYRDLPGEEADGLLLKMGFGPDQIADLHQHILDAGGDVNKGITGWMSQNPFERRTLAFLGEDLVKSLNEHDMYDLVLDGLRNANSPEDFAKRLDDLMVERAEYAQRSFLEEVVPDPDDMYGDELIDMQRTFDEQGLTRGKNDLLARRMTMRSALHAKYREAAEKLNDLVVDKLMAAKQDPSEVRKALEGVRKRVAVVTATEKKEAQAKLAEIIQRTKEARQNQDWDTYHQLWDDWMKQGGVRDQIHMKYRKDVVKEYEDYFAWMQKAAPDVSLQEVDNARGLAKLNEQWDHADEQRFLRTGKVYLQAEAQPKLPENDAEALALFDKQVAGETLDEVGQQQLDDFVKRHASEDEIRRMYPSNREKVDKMRANVTAGKYQTWPQRIRDHVRMWAESKLQELEDARPGKRIFIEGETGGDVKVIPEGSTFPDWYRTMSVQNKDSILSALEDLTGRKFTDKGKSVLHKELLDMAWVDLFDEADTYYYPLNLIAVGDTGKARAFVDTKMAAGFDFLTQYDNANDSNAVDAILNLLGKEMAPIDPELYKQMRADIFGRVAAGNVEKPLQTGLASNTPSMHRVVQENLDGVTHVVNQVKAAAGQFWGNLDAPRVITPQQEGALAQFQDVMSRRWADARAAAMQVGDAARKFTLLDYGDKRGLDLALAYVFPYQFWYSRSYANWFKRIAENPWIGASYAKYRTALEKVHAGMPAWWKYNVNTNELLGLDSDNPLFFNLEATLNPLNGITGVDFDDPDRQRTWFSQLVDGASKLGPSVWTPLTLAMGAAFYLGGDKDAGESWIGRTIPLTAQVKAATGLMGIRGSGNILTPGGLELDPSMILQGGMGKYDRKRVGRMLATMTEYPEEQRIEAAYSQSGPLWEEAWRRSEQGRAVGTMTGLVGVGLKGRSQGDMLVDQFYSEMNALYSRRPELSDPEYTAAWDAMKEKYPFMDTLLLSRKATPQRDSALAYNVLSRIPPGQQNDFAALVRLDPRLMEKFYTDKGKIEAWAQSDRERFMAAVRDLGSVLAVPPTTLRREWNNAKNRSRQLNSQAQGVFGEFILDEVDTYYSYKDNPQQGEAFLSSHPEVEQYLDWRSQMVMNDPILREYYGGIDFYEKFLKRQMYSEAEQKFGKDITRLESMYFDIKDDGGDVERFKRDNPILYEYWDFKEAWKLKIAASLEDAANLFPDSPQAIIRPDAKLQALGAQDVFAGMNEMTDTDAEYDSIVASYRQKQYDSTFSLTEFINQEAEKMWPGVLDLQEEFERLSVTQPGAAQRLYVTSPELQQFMQWEKGIRKQYNNAQAGKFPAASTQTDWRMFLGNDSLYRLILDTKQGRSLPVDAKRLLEPYAKQMNVSVDALIRMIAG